MNLGLKVYTIWNVIVILVFLVFMLLFPNDIALFGLMAVLLFYGFIVYYFSRQEEKALHECTSLENTKEYAKKVHLSDMYEDC